VRPSGSWRGRWGLYDPRRDNGAVKADERFDRVLVLRRLARSHAGALRMLRFIPVVVPWTTLRDPPAARRSSVPESAVECAGTSGQIPPQCVIKSRRKSGQVGLENALRLQ
jgi:hypothetical protein